jgi:hypothetical protein
VTALRSYIVQLRSVGVQIARYLGEDISRENDAERIKLNVVLAMNSVLIKLLVDAGVLTDAQVSAAYSALLTDPTQYPDVPPPPPY